MPSLTASPTINVGKRAIPIPLISASQIKFPLLAYSEPSTETFSLSPCLFSITPASLKGNLTLHGVTKEVVQVGAGKDPWGGYRRGFEGKTRIALRDFGNTKNLGPASAELDLIIAFEGIKK